ncbi:MAG: glycogen synthase GlgA [Clostridium sp.]|uniref:glycogen synthase GlgA n=1 Tax=Clostridium sp. TaxID=1506 RepID=UPI00290954A4|nr:glycogen synthase GlgA [Clostridium sp.]MDU7338539.1 glycogen synthase GlgA [Clostridium sp.]
MKVLYCTSEALPFAATGGLGDVAGSLPQALRRRLIGCRVVMPLYDDIPQELRDQMHFVTSLSVPVAWRRQYCGVFEAKAGGVIYYLIDNQYYFKRPGLYGHYDDAERFAFLSRAALEMLPAIDFKPDIIHSNDWQTAMVPVYFRLFYANNPWYEGIKTIVTIHNIQYQGKYGKELIRDVLGVPESAAQLLEYDDCVNMLKGGIECANWVTTVSPTYANEILDSWFAYGLEGILNSRSWKLSGILNGIDNVHYDPENDATLAAPFSAEDPTGKAENKRALQEQLGLAQDAGAPLVGMVSRLVAQKGLDLVRDSFERIMQETDAQFVLLGTGEYEYECFFRDMQSRYPGRVCAFIGFAPEISRRVYAGCDIFLMPSKSEPCGLSQMIALRYGTIPVVRETGGLKDSIQDSGDGEGNGFTFQTYDSGDMVYALYRALEGYANQEGWDILVRRAMACDNSWGRSANEYIRLYRELLKQ